MFDPQLMLSPYNKNLCWVSADNTKMPDMVAQSAMPSKVFSTRTKTRTPKQKSKVITYGMTK